jgi:hypothetical protein
MQPRLEQRTRWHFEYKQIQGAWKPGRLALLFRPELTEVWL